VIEIGLRAKISQISIAKNVHIRSDSKTRSGRRRFYAPEFILRDQIKRKIIIKQLEKEH